MLTAEHAELLSAQAITPEAAERFGLRSAVDEAELPDEHRWRGRDVLPALVFPWREPDGRVTTQLRPDRPVSDKDGRPAKYVWPKGGVALLGEFRPGGATMLVVEGTKQALVAAWYAPASVAVYGIAGCRTWQQDGVPTPHLAVCEGRSVVICLDSDAADNLDVYEAGLKLAEACTVEGATRVTFMRVPGSRKAGLDDVLGRRPETSRRAYLARLIAGAAAKPADVKPAARRIKTPELDDLEDDSPYFDKAGLRVADLFDAVTSASPAALTQEGKVALYRDGVYHLDGAAYSGTVASLLANRFRPAHRAAVEEYTEGMLYRSGRVLPVHVDVPVLNLKNGMLDLETGRLKPHDPSYLSAIQFPVMWDEDARAPRYEEWLASTIPSQADDLEEVASTMLDPSRTPPKALFLFGPSRSGKSTFLRLLQAVAGTQNTSAVTLHQLAANRFAAANVYGKALNVAADLSAAHVEDISIFKMLTGEDMINADRKYGSQFAFVNRALFAFSANELPTVGESSRAYAERIKPFAFARSFAGRESPDVEARMRTELPGILARWVAAWQRLQARGTYLQTDAGVREDFEARSDRVRQWLAEQARIWGEDVDGLPVRPGARMPAGRATAPGQLARAFNTWAEANGGSKMGLRKVLDRLESVPGVVEVRALPARSRALNVTLSDRSNDEWLESHAPERAESLSKLPADVSKLPARAETEARGQIRGQIQTEGLGTSGTEPTSSRADSSQNFSPVGTCPVTPQDAGLSVTKGSQDPIPDEIVLPRICPRIDAGRHDEIELATYRHPASVTLPEGVAGFDIETGSSEDLWTADPSRFIRLVGVQTGSEVRVTDDPIAAAAELGQARRLVGHNLMGFDIWALARLAGWDVHRMTADRRIWDTMLAEVLTNPPSPDLRPEQVLRANRLDHLGAGKFGTGKSLDLAKLARQFGGFDRIPTDHADYVAYCAADVDLATRIAAGQPATEYIWREHQVAAIAGQIRQNGFRVDLDLLAARLEAGHKRRAELVAWLRQRVSLPATNKAGKPVKSPQATEAGRLAIEEAFERLGVELPTTRTGGPALGREALDEVGKAYADHPEVCQLVEALQALNGVRSVYDTVERYRRGDRVHPEISMVQASGRWSTTKPGLTVFGKRGGRHVEREVFLPEPGCQIISADLSQVDARAVAAWAQDDAYLDLFEPGRDSHTEIALAVWGDAARRSDAKVIGHGWNYQMGLANLARQCGSEAAARQYDQAMRDRYPKLVAWKRETAERAQAGELLDNGFGRMMRPDPRRGWTQGPALMGQGTARDLMMEGLLRLPAELLPMLRAVVHDEVILSVPVDIVGDVEAAVVEALSFEWAPPSGGRPVRIEAGLADRRGANWGGCYAK